MAAGAAPSSSRSQGTVSPPRARHAPRRHPTRGLRERGETTRSASAAGRERGETPRGAARPATRRGGASAAGRGGGCGPRAGSAPAAGPRGGQAEAEGPGRGGAARPRGHHGELRGAAPQRRAGRGKPFCEAAGTSHLCPRRAWVGAHSKRGIGQGVVGLGEQGFKMIILHPSSIVFFFFNSVI